MNKPRFKIFKGDPTLQAIVNKKDDDAIIAAADHWTLCDKYDMFEAGVKIGLMMAAQGTRNAVVLPVFAHNFDGEVFFIGTLQQVKRRLKSLPDA